MCFGRCVCVLLVVFFFKQKTAYEVRISDWSSDVCSSDLAVDILDAAPTVERRRVDGVMGGYSMLVLPRGGELAMQDDTLVMPEHRGRSEARRVGNEGVSTCRSRLSPYH